MIIHSYTFSLKYPETDLTRIVLNATLRQSSHAWLPYWRGVHFGGGERDVSGRQSFHSRSRWTVNIWLTTSTVSRWLPCRRSDWRVTSPSRRSTSTVSTSASVSFRILLSGRITVGVPSQLRLPDWVFVHLLAIGLFAIAVDTSGNS